MKKHFIRLSPEERIELTALANKERVDAQAKQRAQVFLLADSGEQGPAKTDQAIADVMGVTVQTVERLRAWACEVGPLAGLKRRPSTRVFPRKLDGRAEARLIVLAKEAAPEGRSTWTLQLLADQMVALGIVDSLDDNTVWRTLKKNELKPHLSKYWVIPPKGDASFVAAMEDVLSVYERPYDPKRPVVCMDEASRQLLSETRPSFVDRNGKRCQDYEYVRHGERKLFLATETLGCRRTVRVTATRTAKDWARFVKEEILDPHPDADRVVLVCDNLNPHVPAAFYETYPPEEAKRILDRLEIHYTPKHGSWLNVAEIELSVLQGECLKDRRIGTEQALRTEVETWADGRNTRQKGVKWQFTTADARIKLLKLYPTVI